MNQRFLSLTPKRFLCPYCGEWHEWNNEHNLEYYDSDYYQAQLKCSNAALLCCYEGDYRIYFCNGYCYYSTDEMCYRADLSIRGKFPISSINESTDMPTVTFEVPFTADSDVGSEECDDCIFNEECLCVKLGDKGDNLHMTITLGFEFEESDYKELAFALKEKKLQEQEQAIDSKEKALKEFEQTIAIENRALKRFKRQEEKVLKQKLLRLTPKRFLCPYCGEWHVWKHEHNLEYYDSEYDSAILRCSNPPPFTPPYNGGDYRIYLGGCYIIYFFGRYFYYSTDAICNRSTFSIGGKIPISSIIESTDMPAVTFEVPFIAKNDVGSEECSDCIFKDKCMCVKLGDKGDKRHMTITLGFEFEQSEYEELASVLKVKELQRQEQVQRPDE